MILRLESRLARLEKKQAETGGVTVRLVFDRNFYGNAHLLPPDAWASDRQAREDGTASKPGGEDDNETA